MSKLCAACGSDNVVQNLNTNQVFCFDCKSTEVYRRCYTCKQPITDQPKDGSDNWHHNNQQYKMPDGKMVSCWEWEKFNDVCNEECT